MQEITLRSATQALQPMGGPHREGIEGLTKRTTEGGGGGAGGGDANLVESRWRQRPPDPTSLEHDKGERCYWWWWCREE